MVSAEQVELEFPIAGSSSRMLAYSIDLAILIALQAGLFMLLASGADVAGRLGEWLGNLGDAGSEGATALQAALAAYVVASFLLEIVYFVAWDMALGGRSPGKAWVGLRVVRDGGLPITLRESLLRNVMRMVDALPASYGIGVVAMLVSPEHRLLGDLVAGTLVVRLDRLGSPRRLDLGDDDLGRFRFDRAQLARAGRNELRLARQTLRRLPELRAEQARSALARSAEVVRERIGYEEVPESERAEFLRALLRATRRR